MHISSGTYNLACNFRESHRLPGVYPRTPETHGFLLRISALKMGPYLLFLKPNLISPSSSVSVIYCCVINHPNT
jgi:hypothetical protein